MGDPRGYQPFDMLVEQGREGLEFLKEEFGVYPNIGWQVTSDAYSLEEQKESGAQIAES